MKKLLSSVIAIIMSAVVMMPTTTFAANGECSNRILISTEKITLTPNVTKARSSESKEFTLTTYNENGFIAYSFDIDDQAYRQAGMEYINSLMGDQENMIQPMAVLNPGESEYHNDKQYDGDAIAYAWKKNTANNGNHFEGGQSAMWNGTGNCDKIILNQAITVSGYNVTVSWPPAVSSSGYTAQMRSEPFYDNLAGMSFNGMYVPNTTFAVSFVESGEVYVNNRAYKPITNIMFSYES